MNDVVIRVEGLSKRYRIGAQQASYRTLRETIVDVASAPARRLASVLRGQASTKSNETIWALKDVSFDVRQGEAVGIIGRNGAGKTTLLKLLSRITKPTEGKISLDGRVGSLLEVGTGFHPELTGRENIFLNGAILGMRRVEIEHRFDEIVDFSEIEKFLDTPVKHYSSGMYVRLAFAVAAHLEPEILLVDEVLAVGDYKFQQKCLGKMDKIARGGRTVLFISHNMGAIENLCPRTLYINNGQISGDGDTKDIIESYINLVQDAKKTDIPIGQLPRKGDFGEKVRIVDCELLGKDFSPTNVYKAGEQIIINVELKSIDNDYDDLFLNIGINTTNQIRIATVTTRTDYGFFSCSKGKTVSVKALFGAPFLAPGSYNITASVGNRGRGLDQVEFALLFEVVEVNESVIYYRHLPGFIHAKASWKVETG